MVVLFEIREVIGCGDFPSFPKIVVLLWKNIGEFKITKIFGLRRVEVNIDYKLVVRAIQREGCNDHSCSVLIREIKKLIEEHEIVIIYHIFR